MVISHQTFTELFDYMPTLLVFLLTFMQSSITFCNLQQVAGDAIFGVAVGEVGLDIYVKCGDSGPNHSCFIRLARFVIDSERRSI